VGVLKNEKIMTATEKKYFNQIKTAMQEAGIYSAPNDTLIEHAALTLVMIDAAKQAVKKQGQIQKFKTGARQISPEVNNLRGLLSDFRKYAETLGLSPATLQKLGGKDDKEEEAPKVSIMRLAK
jgi:P27 family predicted phage terminase small subunit